MSRHAGPRIGSQQHKALVALHAQGGIATPAEFMNAVQWAGSVDRFRYSIADSLVQSGLIVTFGDRYRVTDEGLNFLGIPLGAPPVKPAPVVGPRYAAPQRELSSRHFIRMASARPGAMDYASIPSVMRNERVAHAAGVKLLEA